VGIRFSEEIHHVAIDHQSHATIGWTCPKVIDERRQEVATSEDLKPWDAADVQVRDDVQFVEFRHWIDGHGLGHLISGINDLLHDSERGGESRPPWASGGVERGIFRRPFN
jgi:hypothetical protein